MVIEKRLSDGTFEFHKRMAFAIGFRFLTPISGPWSPPNDEARTVARVEVIAVRPHPEDPTQVIHTGMWID